MHGVSFVSESQSEQVMQNAFHCEYDYDTFVNNVLACGPDGKVFICSLNCPENGADGSLTACFSPHIFKRIGSCKNCVYQGFPDLLNQCAACCLHPQMREYLLQVSNVYASL